MGNDGVLETGLSAKAAGLLCIVGAAISFLAGHSPRLFSRLIALRVALAVYMTISVLWSFEAVEVSDTILRVGQLLVFVVLIWEIAVSYSDQLWLMRSFLVGMSIPLAMQVVTLGSLSRQADAEFRRIFRRRPGRQLLGADAHRLARDGCIPGNQRDEKR